MCHKTSYQYRCGCTKLAKMTFCTWASNASHLMSSGGGGIHHYGRPCPFDTIVSLKIQHDMDLVVDPDLAAVARTGDAEDAVQCVRCVEEEFEACRRRCERDTVLCTQSQEGECAFCRKRTASLPEGVVLVSQGSGGVRR